MAELYVKVVIKKQKIMDLKKQIQREIKFRGFSTDLNKWVYGSLVNNMWTYSELTDRKGQPVCEIITGEYDADNWEDAINDPDCVIKVTPESVGQFVKQENGFDIWENDICTFTNPYNKTSYTRVVRFCHHLACFGLYPNMTEEWQYESDWLKITDVKIIGNLYQNPELIK